MSSFGSHKYILVGPSGTGKTTMSKALEEVLGLVRCVTSTTRQPRPEEISTNAYYFENSFVGIDMFEHSKFGGHEYGITKEALAAGDFVILEPQGVAFYKENYPGPLTVIALQRNGIDVDPERRARDAGAGFDQVNPDITIYGETVESMRENLIAAILSYEMNRRRETGVSYLPEYTSSREAHGSVRLSFQDSTFDLPVTCSQTHLEYREPPYGYDGLECFEAANYNALLDAFKEMSKTGKPCTLDFHLEDESYKTLFSCRLIPEHNQILGEIYPEYLLMEPLTFYAQTPEEAVDLALGGFIAAENDALGITNDHCLDPDLAKNFRKVLSEGNFTLLCSDAPARKPSLAAQIAGAEQTAHIHMKKMFDTNVQNFFFPENER